MTEAPIKFWSFSALKQFEACPYAIQLSRIDRSPRPVLPDDNPLTRGTVIHKAAELFVKGEGPLVKELMKHKDRLEELAEAYGNGRVEAEQKWWFDRDWRPVNDDDPSKWVIMITDATEHINENSARITDYKTGKSFNKEIRHTEQMQLCAIGAFARYPKLVVVETEVIYLDETKAPVRRRYERTKLPALVPRWEARGNRLTSATTFKPKPNKGNCRYCDFGPNNNGTGACPYGVEI